jgi:hypothetical protein
MPTLPLAHVVHQLLWILYAIPILIVAVAIVRSTIAQRRADREDSAG